MRHGTPDNAPVSDATYRAESLRLSSSTTEGGFLADRTADASAAIGRKLCDMKETLTKMTGLGSCAARHPWIVTGSAIAAGVVVGAALTPSARKRTRNAPKTPSGSVAGAPPAGREPEAPRAIKSVLFSIAGTVLAAVLQPLLQSWLAPAVTAQGESRGAPPLTGDSAGAIEFGNGVD